MSARASVSVVSFTVAALFLAVVLVPSAALATGPPWILDAGWEAADGDPAGGLVELERLRWRPADPLREQAPRGTVRWYRIRIEMTPARGAGPDAASLPLAFSVSGLRDVDETYFQGVRIGGQGSFPPRTDPANLVSRLYPIPPDLVTLPGPKTLALRVYHGRRDGTVFRLPPVVDELARLAAVRSSVDQGSSLFLGVTLTISLVLVILWLHVRPAPEFLLFAALSGLLGLYGLTLHSGWAVWPVPKITPFRLGVASMTLIGICYLESLCRLVRIPVPRRFWIWYAWFATLALLSVLVSDTEDLVWPLRLYPWVHMASLIDLLGPLSLALRGRRRHVGLLLFGHGAFSVGVALHGELARVGPGTGRLLLAGGFLVLAAAFLWAVSDQLSRFRVAALTDPATRLWNRVALFDTIGDRAESSRKGKASFGLVLADLDRFKDWNDRKGHLAGDRLLLRVARALTEGSRPGDLVARYGGDEFAVVLDDVDVPTARAVAERLHRGIKDAIRSETGEDRVGVTLGVALFDPARHATSADLFNDSDRALYEAKAAGKDRVLVLDPKAASGEKRRRESGSFLASMRRPGGSGRRE